MGISHQNKTYSNHVVLFMTRILPLVEAMSTTPLLKEVQDAPQTLQIVTPLLLSLTVKSDILKSLLGRCPADMRMKGMPLYLEYMTQNNMTLRSPRVPMSRMDGSRSMSNRGVILLC
jgi:hypothetical protein